MVSNNELKTLIERVRDMGADVKVSYDLDLWTKEGRQIIDGVQIKGLPGCGPYPMSAMGAAETIRRLIRDYVPGQKFIFNLGDKVQGTPYPGKTYQGVVIGFPDVGKVRVRLIGTPWVALNVISVFPDCYPKN